MNVWRRIRHWLCRPPKTKVNGWDVAASLGFWELWAIPLMLLVGIVFGRQAGAAAALPALALTMLGFWLRTGRHWHPIDDLKTDWRKQ